MRSYIQIIKTGLRSCYKNPAFYLINCLGFIGGFTGLILLVFYLSNELTFNKNIPEHNKIHRLTTTFIYNGQENSFALNEAIWDIIMENEVPEVQYSTAFIRSKNQQIFKDERIFYNTDIIFSDYDFNKVFQFPVLTGSPELTDQNVIITKRTALKWFGHFEESIIGNIISWKSNGLDQLFTIAAIIEDPPANSTIQFDVIIPGHFLPWWNNQFDVTKKDGSNQFHIYFKTYQPIETEDLQSTFNKIFANYKGDIEGFTYLTTVQSLTDIHWNSNNQFELQPSGNWKYVIIISSVSTCFIFILLLNGLNFNVIRYSQKLRDFGIRKAFGQTSFIIARFILAENFLIFFLLFIAAYALSLQIIESGILSTGGTDKSLFMQPNFITICLMLVLLFSFITFFLPFYFGSRFSIRKSLTTRSIISSRFVIKGNLYLVSGQVLASIVLLSFLAVVNQQVKFINVFDPGFNKNNVLTIIRPSSASQSQWNEFLTEIGKESSVVNVATSTNPILGSDTMSPAQFTWQSNNTWAHWNMVSREFINTLEIHLKNGYDFNQSTDSAVALINESAVKKLELDNELNGEKISSWMGQYSIIGSFADFQYTSLGQVSSPMILLLNDHFSTIAFIRFNSNNERIIALTNSHFLSAFGYEDVDYSFLKDDYNSLYSKELEAQKILLIFGIITLLITTTGIISVVNALGKYLKKEMAIRKTLGAINSQLYIYYSLRIFKPVIGAILLSIPLIYSLSYNWLNDFSKKVPLSMIVFVAPFAFIILLVLISSSIQLSRHTNESPLSSLRNDE